MSQTFDQKIKAEVKIYCSFMQCDYSKETGFNNCCTLQLYCTKSKEHFLLQSKECSKSKWNQEESFFHSFRVRNCSTKTLDYVPCNLLVAVKHENRLYFDFGVINILVLHIIIEMREVYPCECCQQALVLLLGVAAYSDCRSRGRMDFSGLTDILFYFQF